MGEAAIATTAGRRRRQGGEPVDDAGDRLMKRLYPPPRSGRRETSLALRDAAEEAFSALREAIKSFEGALNEEQEIGVFLVSSADGRTFHAETIEHRAGLIIFSGAMDGRPIRLVQHHTQLSILLTAVETTAATPRRIGFIYPPPNQQEKGT